MNRSEFFELTTQLLVHKFMYYENDNPVLTDYEYDMLEKDWREGGQSLGINMDAYPNWVGFDRNHPLANKALARIKKL